MLSDENRVKPFTVDGIPVRKLFVSNLAQRVSVPVDVRYALFTKRLLNFLDYTQGS